MALTPAVRAVHDYGEKANPVWKAAAVTFAQSAYVAKPFNLQDSPLDA
jgi:hypothetical protein